MASLFELPPSAKKFDSVPLKYGIIVYPGYQALDVFGPLDALNSLAFAYPLELAVIADTLDPVSTSPPAVVNINSNPNFAQTINPTHTFASAPALDVLIVPGGIGNRFPADVEGVVEYIRRIYPDLKYLITVCTGSALVARAGILDGKSATTNKSVYTRVAQSHPDVRWIAHARWVVDGNIWTSSGVSAGLDVIFAFMSNVFGEEVAKMIADHLEYERHTNPSWDPFAELYQLPVNT